MKRASPSDPLSSQVPAKVYPEGDSLMLIVNDDVSAFLGPRPVLALEAQRARHVAQRYSLRVLFKLIFFDNLNSNLLVGVFALFYYILVTFLNNFCHYS